MQLLCSICNDLFEQQSDVAVTPCGHIYHDACISEWFKSSKTCPKCRCQVRPGTMHKVYFDVDNGTDPLVQAFQKKIDSLSVGLEEKDLIIKLVVDDNKKLQEANDSLKEEIVNHKMHEHLYKSTISASEKKIESLKENIGNLEEKLKYYKDLTTDLRKVRGNFVPSTIKSSLVNIMVKGADKENVAVKRNIGINFMNCNIINNHQR